jgi:hypothetical protein
MSMVVEIFFIGCVSSGYALYKSFFGMGAMCLMHKSLENISYTLQSLTINSG